MGFVTPRRLLGTPVLVDEVGGFIGNTSEQVPTRVASASPGEHFKRLPGTPCFVTASGAIVALPFAHRSDLRRLLGTPCLVTDTGEIVGSSPCTDPCLKRPTAECSLTPARLLGTPCFVAANGEFIGPAQSPVRLSGPGRMLGTPVTGSGDKQLHIPSAVPVETAVAVPVLQAHTASGFSECNFLPADAASDKEQQRKQLLVVEMEARIADLKRQIRELSM